MEKLSLLVIFYLSGLICTSGEVAVSTIPQKPSRNAQVNVECVVEVPPDVDGCRIWWSRTVYPGGRHKANNEGISSSTNMQIYTMFDTDIKRYKSVIIMKKLTEPLEGLYTCNLMCHTFSQSSSIDLRVDEGPLHMPSVVGLVIVGCVVVAALMLGAIIKFCSKRHHSASSVSSRSSSSRSSVSTICNNDAPPRYSVAVETTADGSVQTVLRDRSHAYSIAFMGTPPPDYAQAIQDLQSKGLLFNLTLEPMPPAYSDVQKYSLSQLDTDQV